ncbi:hypothetical protein B0T09DRAFT_321153 [Sordaria sp. MPI-SDFR-AT-0083]|nr:hypothetical protein B0T09DRAFT_321153 [Sordaria sp. MPI-SDFR-AT-0083]
MDWRASSVEPYSSRDTQHKHVHYAERPPVNSNYPSALTPTDRGASSIEPCSSRDPRHQSVHYTRRPPVNSNYRSPISSVDRGASSIEPCSSRDTRHQPVHCNERPPVRHHPDPIRNSFQQDVYNGFFSRASLVPTPSKPSNVEELSGHNVPYLPLHVHPFTPLAPRVNRLVVPPIVTPAQQQGGQGEAGGSSSKGAATTVDFSHHHDYSELGDFARRLIREDSEWREHMAHGEAARHQEPVHQAKSLNRDDSRVTEDTYMEQEGGHNTRKRIEAWIEASKRSKKGPDATTNMDTEG